MAIQAGPACSAYVDITETGTAGTTSAGVPQDHPQLGGRSSPKITWAPGTGTGTSINLQASAQGSLVATTINIDLTSVNTPIQTGRTFAKIRGIYVENQAAADSGFGLKVYSGASNGWTYGPFPATPGVSIPANSRLYIENANIGSLAAGGWGVDATHKVLTLDSGANTVAYAWGVWGE